MLLASQELVEKTARKVFKNVIKEKNNPNVTIQRRDVLKTDTLFRGEPEELIKFLSSLKITFLIHRVKTDEGKLLILKNSLTNSTAS